MALAQGVKTAIVVTSPTNNAPWLVGSAVSVIVYMDVTFPDARTSTGGLLYLGNINNAGVSTQSYKLCQTTSQLLAPIACPPNFAPLSLCTASQCTFSWPVVQTPPIPANGTTGIVCFSVTATNNFCMGSFVRFEAPVIPVTPTSTKMAPVTSSVVVPSPSSSRTPRSSPPPQTSSKTPPPNTSSTGSPSVGSGGSDSGPDLVIIIGASVGGAALLILAFITFYLIRHQRRRKEDAEELDLSIFNRPANFKSGGASATPPPPTTPTPSQSKRLSRTMSGSAIDRLGIANGAVVPMSELEVVRQSTLNGNHQQPQQQSSKPTMSIVVNNTVVTVPVPEDQATRNKRHRDSRLYIDKDGSLIPLQTAMTRQASGVFNDTNGMMDPQQQQQQQHGVVPPQPPQGYAYAPQQNLQEQQPQPAYYNSGAAVVWDHQRPHGMEPMSPPASPPMVNFYHAEVNGVTFPGYYDPFGQYHFFKTAQEAAFAAALAQQSAMGVMPPPPPPPQQQTLTRNATALPDYSPPESVVSHKSMMEQMEKSLMESDLAREENVEKKDLSAFPRDVVGAYEEKKDRSVFPQDVAAYEEKKDRSTFPADKDDSYFEASVVRSNSKRSEVTAAAAPKMSIDAPRSDDGSEPQTPTPTTTARKSPTTPDQVFESRVEKLADEISASSDDDAPITVDTTTLHQKQQRSSITSRALPDLPADESPLHSTTSTHPELEMIQTTSESIAPTPPPKSGTESLADSSNTTPFLTAPERRSSLPVSPARPSVSDIMHRGGVSRPTSPLAHRLPDPTPEDSSSRDPSLSRSLAELEPSSTVDVLVNNVIVPVGVSRGRSIDIPVSTDLARKVSTGGGGGGRFVSLGRNKNNEDVKLDGVMLENAGSAGFEFPIMLSLPVWKQDDRLPDVPDKDPTTPSS